MSIYRQQVILKNQSSYEDYFYYLEFKNDYIHNYDYCPICKNTNIIRNSKFWFFVDSLLGDRFALKISCNPNNRINVKNFFKRKTCPIPDFHIHYICSTCKYHQIEFVNITQDIKQIYLA